MREARRMQTAENADGAERGAFGVFRVFYDMSHEDQVVAVMAIGRKTHNRLWIGGEEIEL